MNKRQELGKTTQDFPGAAAGRRHHSSRRKLLVAIKGAVDSAVQEQRPQLQESVRERFVAEYHSIINAGLRANSAPPEAPGSPKKRGRKKQSKARNLLLRLASRLASGASVHG